MRNFADFAVSYTALRARSPHVQVDERMSAAQMMTDPDTPAAFSNLPIRVGGRTISLSMLVSVVTGWPSSNISSISCRSVYWA